MLPFWILQTLTIFFKTAKSSLAISLKFPEISLTWFLCTSRSRVFKPSRVGPRMVYIRSKAIRGRKGQNSAETRFRGFLVLESRCRGFSSLESRCRGFLYSEKISWNHDVVG